MPVFSANTGIDTHEKNLTKDEVLALLEEAQENISCSAVQEREGLGSARWHLLEHPGHIYLCEEQVRIMPFPKSLNLLFYTFKDYKHKRSFSPPQRLFSIFFCELNYFVN